MHRAVEPVAPPTPVVVPPPPVDAEATRLEASLAQAPETELTAFTQLLARWQVDASAVSVRDASRCPTIIAAGIACLRGHAMLDQVTRFDRPLILLLGPTEHPSYALLQGAGKQHVRLDLAGARYELARASLSKVWNGDFIVLWRLPADVPASLQRGESGAGVAWITDRLATFDNGIGAKARAPVFDAELEERVRKLQLAYGIKADGIIGPETLFALSALDDAGPHLARTVE
jgi:general secretion pathway protein A